MDIKNIFLRSFRDAIGWTYPTVSRETYIEAAAAWLMRAQDMSTDGGVSAQYALLNGWDGSYIETTGYILVTFFTLARVLHRQEFRQRAIRMANFLLKVQLSTGAFQSGTPQDLPAVPRVFNTGEDVRGLLAAFRETKEKRYLTAAGKAADWLISMQEADGSWQKDEFQAKKHAYHSRTSWALLEVWKETRKEKYRSVARKNLRWVLKQQHENGWFGACDFTSPSDPFTHAIDYTVSGLLESAAILHDANIWKAGKRAADALLRYFNRHQYMPATFDSRWHSRDRYTCLTGNAQIVLTWFSLYRKTKKNTYFLAAIKLLEQLKKTVDVSTSDPNIRGAVAGAHPIYGGYSRFNYPNWATKFFLDAIIEEERLAS